MAVASSFQGVVWVLLAAVLWGTTGTAQSMASGALPAAWVGALRLVFAGAFFGLLALWVLRTPQPQQHANAPMPRARLLLCVGCMAVYNLSFFAALRSTGVGLGTAVALGSSPVWAGLLQALLLRQWPARAWWLGTALGVAGGFCMAWANPGAHTTSAGTNLGLGMGLALCLLAGLSYGCYAVLAQPLIQHSGIARVNAGVFGAAAAVALPVAWAVQGPLPAAMPQDWAVVAYLGLVATGVAYLLFSAGLRHISAATSVALSKFEPVTAFVLSMVVVGEQPSWLASAGLCLLLLGLSLVVRSEISIRP